MNKKYLAINRIHCFDEYTKDEVEGDRFFEKWEVLELELKELLAKHGLMYKSHDAMFVNKVKQSLSNCVQCGNWMVDREMNPVGMPEDEFKEEIYDGACIDSKPLCEMCLPGDHRWGIEGNPAYA